MLAASDHLWPFQDSTTVSWYWNPTAVQTVVETQDTLTRPASSRFCGLGATDQVLPFQISVTGSAASAGPYSPTAAQKAAVTQETLERVSGFWPVSGLGLGTIDHALPFQVSTRVRGRGLLADGAELPTAVQALADTHETPSSSSKPGLLRLCAIDQAVPFQRSTRVLPPPRPTAVQDLADRQVTPNSSSSASLSGLGTTRQLSGRTMAGWDGAGLE
jgi:hypothetical protein